MATTVREIATEKVAQWKGFNVGLWQNRIDVRDFIQQNYQPYPADGSFLAPPTERTKKIWARLNELFLEERRKGVLDRKSTRLNSSHSQISYAVFCLKKKKNKNLLTQ